MVLKSLSWDVTHLQPGYLAKGSRHSFEDIIALIRNGHFPIRSVWTIGLPDFGPGNQSYETFALISYGVESIPLGTDYGPLTINCRIFEEGDVFDLRRIVMNTLGQEPQNISLLPNSRTTFIYQGNSSEVSR